MGYEKWRPATKGDAYFMTGRLLALLVCLTGSAAAQTAGAPRPVTPPLRPPVIPFRPNMPAIGPTLPTLPTLQPRKVPMPGHPGRFIICPGDRRCPRQH
jgi:hypothetical protein